MPSKSSDLPLLIGIVIVYFQLLFQNAIERQTGAVMNRARVGRIDD